LTGDSPASIFDAALACLSAADPELKVALSRDTAAAWRAGRLGMESASPPRAIQEPGRPPRPELVPPRALPKRSLGSGRGRAALIHAVAHIELNAVDLAWDAVYRFRGLPVDYYADWVRVADEEAQHFGLMRGRLAALGFDYGDFPAHDGLWSLARRTAHDPLVRMAMIPRVMEARGLDVTPGMIARFRGVGDEETASCLAVILRDEVGHVAAGSRWFNYLCHERGLDPQVVYFQLLGEYLGGEVKCPLNIPDRRRGGFAEGELQRLEAMCKAGRAQATGGRGPT
jgi:uncharacterized ferritin-like protein (DUF455 family)